MQRKVLLIDDSQVCMNLLIKLANRAGLIPVCAASLAEAKYTFGNSKPEEYLCAVVDYHLPDAPRGQAIDFTIMSFLPTIVITGHIDNETRENVLARHVVDYIPKENSQVYDYLSRLLGRLEKNKTIGVLIVDPQRRSRASIASLLKRHHFMTYQAANAHQAKEELLKYPHIKMLLLDSHINDDSATALVADLRKTYGKDDLVIIGLSDDDSNLWSARFIKSGANDFLRKPFCHEEFLCRITQNIELLENVEAIRRAANSDYLTGLPNRRHFFHCVAQYPPESLTNKCLGIIDLDHFKGVNDNYGHDAGDAVLTAVATQIREQFKGMIVARFGGEEFCVFLPNVSPKKAYQKLEKFRLSIATTPILYQDCAIDTSVSIGLTLVPEHQIEAMIAEADRLLYLAKKGGRNKVMVNRPLA
jgi:diguanylate cyclase (GGDEF)-like protein